MSQPPPQVSRTAADFLMLDDLYANALDFVLALNEFKSAFPQSFTVANKMAGELVDSWGALPTAADTVNARLAAWKRWKIFEIRQANDSDFQANPLMPKETWNKLQALYDDYNARAIAAVATMKHSTLTTNVRMM